MVRDKHYSKRAGSRYQRRRRSNYEAPSGSRHRHYGWSRMSTCRPSSPRGRGRDSSIDSLYSRDSSYDRLIRPSNYSNMSPGRHRPPHYDRMVCEAVARLKSKKKGSSIKDIAKSLENKYRDTFKGNGKDTVKKVIATAKKLVKQGKLVKDGSHYRLSKTSSSRRSEDSDCDFYDNDNSSSHRHQKRHSGEKHSSGRRRKRGIPRKRSSSRSESLSLSPSRSSPSRNGRRHTTRHRKRRKGSRAYKTSMRGRGSLKRGTKRRKGARKGQTRLATGKRGPHQKKATRARRRVKHSHSKRPKSDKLPEADSSQAIILHSNKGWFGGWFGGRSGGDSKPDQQGKDKGSSSKPETKRSKPTSERSTGGETRGV